MIKQSRMIFTDRDSWSRSQTLLWPIYYQRLSSPS